MYHGIINVYKEAGYTSHDVVAKLRGICKQKKIGHTGTLDPDAVGVLPVCLGNGTKLCDMLSDRSKEYIAVLRLGVTTDTQDISGKVLQEKSVDVSKEEVEKVIMGFVGDSMQIPPMYSALKVNGKKLYELAREGKVVERKARTVFLREISISRMELPEVSFAVTCSSGTYIRTLCHDIGQKLGCGGCMKSLLRTRVERFVIRDSLRLSQIEEKMAEGRIGDCLIPVDRMFGQYPKVQMKETGDRLVYNGNAFFLRDVASDAIGAAGAEGEVQVRVYDSKGSFVGIYRYEQEVFRPVKMFL